MPTVYLLLAVVFVAAGIPFAAWLSAHRWIRWAHRAAEYGLNDILDARDVSSDEAVAALRAQFDAWTTLVKDGAGRYCRLADAHRVQYFDPPASTHVTGFNDEHRHIKQCTAERVHRLLDLAERLDAGETRLRAYWVPRIN